MALAGLPVLGGLLVQGLVADQVLDELLKEPLEGLLGLLLVPLADDRVLGGGG